MTVLLVAGGSGGHLVPALALAQRLRSLGTACWMLSTRRPVDQLLNSEAIGWHAGELERLTPLWRWICPAYVARQARAARRIRAVLQEVRPNVVVAFGGYLSAVAVLAARRAGIPAVLHEQNVVPGRANRWLAAFARAVAVSFPETQSHLPAKVRVELTGNPIRVHPNGLSQEESCSLWGFNPAKPVLLIMGGSQGSRAVNRLTLSMWANLSQAEREKIQVLHLAGSLDAAPVEAEYRRLNMEARVFPFLNEMEKALTAATLAVSRAGATGIAEMVVFRLPAVLIPYPHAGAHQAANAEWMKNVGGASVLSERNLTPERLWAEIHRLLEDPARLAQMRQRLAAQADGSSAHRLAQLVQEVVG